MILPDMSAITQSITAKLVVIVALTGVLFVPLVMVWALVTERASRRNAVVREVSTVWGRQQTVGGFTLSVPFETSIETADGPRRTTQRIVVLPQSLVVEADVVPEVRRRSIFSVNLYRATLRVSGTFAPPDFAKLGVAPDVVHWQQAALDVNLSDLRGIVSVTPLSWGDETAALAPAPGDGPLGTGLRSIISVPAAATVPFRVDIVIAGSESLMFLPTGAETRVAMRSSWPSPGFVGSVLPLSHDIRADGFQAEWQSNFLARPLPQTWIEGRIEPRSLADKALASAFGMNLVTTVDHYQQTERAVKYGLLFVSLTFAVFFAWEVIERLRVHPVQYLLVGLALIVFYLLLLSLTEHVTFGVAYAVASTATVLLVGSYAGHALGAGWRGVGVAMWLGMLYGLLFVLLGLEDLALLVGSIALFVALAAMMHLTRNVDWYGARARENG